MKEARKAALGFTPIILLLALGVVSVQVAQPVHAANSSVQVNIVDFGFSPASITVVIGVNNTVVWTNTGAADHTVTSNNGAFASGVLAPGNSFKFNFTSPGTYPYHCSIHTFMMGTVTVKGLPTSTTTTTASTTPTPTSCSPSTCINVTIVRDAHVGGVGYSPDSIIVVIGVNATVFWTNNDTAVHTVTSSPGDPVSFSSSQSPGLSTGDTYEYTFTEPGTYVYHCIYHSFMVGIVVVKPPEASATSSALNVSCSHNSVVVGSAVTCKATVRGSGSAPTGAVAWSSSQPVKPSGASCKLSRGACSVKITALAAGSSGLLASYGGDSKNSPSSGAYILTVTTKATKTTVSCKKSVISSLSTVMTCTVKVVGYSPKGMTTWSQTGAGSVALGSTTCTLTTVKSTGTCSVTVTGRTAGQVQLQAAYGGDPNNRGSSGAHTLTVDVTTISTTSTATNPSSTTTATTTTTTTTTSSSYYYNY